MTNEQLMQISEALLQLAKLRATEGCREEAVRLANLANAAATQATVEALWSFLES